MKKHLISLLILVCSSTYLNILPTASSVAAVAETKHRITIDKATIDKGYTVNAFSGALKLSLVPGVLASSTAVESEIIADPMEMPWQLDRIGKIYQFEFKNKVAYDNHKPFYIQVAYDKKDDAYKQLFFYDKNFSSWRPLPTKDFPNEKFVRSLIHLPYARIAVFSFPGTLTSGKASWYSHKSGLFAASPDFPKGSRLRVHNIANGKFVDVEVNDFGPNRVAHPDRPIDLEKAAFQRLASLSEGVINIRVEPLSIARDSEKLVMGIPEKGVNNQISADVRAAIILDQSSGEVLFSKNANTSMPLASLTKIVSVYTFLGLQKDLTKVVKYSNKDAELNYAYCKPWESAKLSIPDGEELTLKDLVYVSLVGSANNTIETLVRVSGLKRADFIAKMNSVVKEWGATSTRFVEPTGLAPENVTTAADYALIAKKALGDKTVSAASIMSVYKFTTKTTKIEKSIRNTNTIIGSTRYKISGSKTGYLDEALYCLMTKAELADGRAVIVVTLGADTRDKSFRETEKLMGYGLRKLQAISI